MKILIDFLSVPMKYFPMRRCRMLVPPEMDGLYHVVSRVVDRRKIFGEEEKRKFRELVVAYAEFSGITVMAWCIMGNHFHLLLDVPAKSAYLPDQLPANEIIRRVGLVNGSTASRELARQLSLCSSDDSRRQILLPYRRRMGDLGLMMKTVKQRFTQWFNRRHERRGTLWEDRYRSVIVEKSDSDASMGGVAKIVAAYIDLNPVRAAMIGDPADYAWSGYGAAKSGDGPSRDSYERLWGLEPDEALWKHRQLLYEGGTAQRIPEDGPKSDRAPIGSPDDAKKSMRKRKAVRVPVPIALRVRLRHLTAGAVIGGRAFLEKLSMKPGVSLPCGSWGSSVRSLRALRVRSVGVPDVPEKNPD